MKVEMIESHFTSSGLFSYVIKITELNGYGYGTLIIRLFVRVKL
jgi:hypothetical protein